MSNEALRVFSDARPRAPKSGQCGLTAGVLLLLATHASTAAAADPNNSANPSTSFWTPRTRLATGLLIGSALAAGAGAAFGLAAVSEQNSASADHQALGADTTACSNPTPAHVGPCADLRNSLTAQNTFAFGQFGSYVAAGGMFLGAVATYFLWPRSREKQATILPYANPASRSAGIVISF
jgi:hypothetical protein